MKYLSVLLLFALSIIGSQPAVARCSREVNTTITATTSSAPSLTAQSPNVSCRLKVLEADSIDPLWDSKIKPEQFIGYITRHEADGSAQAAVANDDDDSMKVAMDKGDRGQLVDVALCLVQLNYLVEARQLLLRVYHECHEVLVAGDGTVSTRACNDDDKAAIADKLAVVEERLGLHKAAVQHINIACPDCWNSILRQGDDQNIVSDYMWIAKQQARVEAAREKRENAEAWNNLSSDERKVIQDHGGSNSGFAYPCHVETYDESNYHEEVWWYGCTDAGYSEGFTFVNGHLNSVYRP